MNITVIVPFFEPIYGGFERNLRYLSNHLISRKHTVTILTLNNGTLKDKEVIENVTVYRFGNYLFKHEQSKGYESIFKHIKSNINSIDLFYMNPNAPMPINEQTEILKYIAEKQIPLIIRVSSIKRAFEFCAYDENAANAYKAATFFLSQNKEIKEELNQIGIPDNKILEVINGTDIDRFSIVDDIVKTTLRKKYKLPINTRIVSTICRFAHKKRLKELITIWSELESNNVINSDKFSLVIVGNSPYSFNDVYESNEIETFINSKLSSSIILIKPEQNDFIQEYFQLSDYYITLSPIEGFPNSCIEALSCGLPIILPKTACYERIYSETNVSFTFESEKELSSNLPFFLNISNKQLNEMRQSTRNLAELKFDISKNIMPIINLFEKLI